MADLTPLINIKAENITAYGELIKTIFTIAFTGLAGISAWITNKNNKLTVKNTKVTEANTAVKGISVESLQAHKDEMTALKDQTVKELRAELAKSVNAIAEEGRRSKLEFMRAFEHAEKKLSHIPKVDDAIEARVTRTERATAKIAVKLGVKLDE